MITYDNIGIHKMSTFTLNLALRMEAELGLGDIVYTEMKSSFGFNNRNSASFISSIESNTMKNHLSLGAMRSLDTKVNA